MMFLSVITPTPRASLVRSTRIGAQRGKRDLKIGASASNVSSRESEDQRHVARRSMIFASSLGAALASALPSQAVDFAEAQAEREARKQAMLEAARAKATGAPLPEGTPEGLGSYEGPDASQLDASKLTYPSSEEQKGQKKAKKEAPSPQRKAAARKRASEEAAKKKEEGGLLTLDKNQLGKDRARRKAELLQKAREKAMTESSAQ
uniref:Uncharacterized protein n=2 Tax=Tetraselmis chuii TaxID=63592 RepID=A0A7S1SH53_9CHLO|mmetsp:Transcript_1062/g.1872  ORF Transcript_1062/g.1872 Transcript_1062/m.1872 type:complete len:206 (+) Transcript_1062:230-847(+)